jgi:hypothetical protein
MRNYRSYSNSLVTIPCTPHHYIVHARVSLLRHDSEDMARALEEHYTVLLLSILCFFLSVVAFTAYSIYASVFVAKFFTVRYLFFGMAVSGLMTIIWVIVRWNRRLLLRGSADSSSLV